jgi:hypothetical protein
MIVTEKNVSTALEYLAIDPHPYALARKHVTDAENKRKEAFARAFISSVGTEFARKAAAEIDSHCMVAKAEEGETHMELERHRARTKAAEMLIEVWRTENANIRAAERIR